MITKHDALTADQFHYGVCTRTVGPRGGVRQHTVECRRNGKTQTWKRSTERFRVPIKHGLYEHAAITEHNAEYFHTEQDCPLNQR